VPRKSYRELADVEAWLGERSYGLERATAAALALPCFTQRRRRTARRVGLEACALGSSGGQTIVDVVRAEAVGEHGERLRHEFAGVADEIEWKRRSPEA
jgi:hypothetical protein